MHFATALSFLPAVPLIWGSFWLWKVSKEKKSISQMKVCAPDLQRSGNHQTHRGRILKELVIVVEGERINLQWEFGPPWEAKEFLLEIAFKGDDSGWIPLMVTDKSGFWQDRMNYGCGRVYRFVVSKRYRPFLGLIQRWFVDVTYDTISAVVRTGHIKESVLYQQDVTALAKSRREALEEMGHAAVAEATVPHLTKRRIEAELGREFQSSAEPKKKTAAEKSEALIEIDKKLKAQIREIYSDESFAEEEKAQLVQDVEVFFDAEKMKIKMEE